MSRIRALVATSAAVVALAGAGCGEDGMNDDEGGGVNLEEPSTTIADGGGGAGSGGEGVEGVEGE